MSFSSNDSNHDYSGQNELPAFHGENVDSSESTDISPDIELVREVLAAQPLTSIPAVAHLQDDDSASENVPLAIRRGRLFMRRVGTPVLPTERTTTAIPLLIDGEEGEEEEAIMVALERATTISRLPKKSKKAKARKKRVIPTRILNHVNKTVDGEVNQTPSILTWAILKRW